MGDGIDGMKSAIKSATVLLLVLGLCAAIEHKPIKDKKTDYHDPNEDGYHPDDPVLYPPNAGIIPPEESAKAHMDRWDKNKDGQLKMDEIIEHMRGIYYD